MKNAPPLRRIGPDHRQVEVDPGRDVRRHQAVAVDHVGQQEVVDVAAMAGHIDHLVALGHRLEPLDAADLDAVVEPVPEPGSNRSMTLTVV
jgi:hypothetical protein